MRNKLTIVLLLLNIVVFAIIWILERSPKQSAAAAAPLADFNMLQVEGKSLDSPRLIRLENNRWRIVKPISWPANFFAVNRIKSQLEYLDRQTSFSVSEIKSHGQTLADYGLDSPSFTFKFGNDKKTTTLKVGKAAPIGNRIYMLDEALDKIIVVDRELVESLAIDIDRLRSQNVFEIPRFEVGSISIRIPQSSGNSGSKFMRIGLVKDGPSWKFESPVAAEANNKAVEGFISSLCALSARSFVSESKAAANFDIGAFPLSITLQGINRRQTLLIGSPVPDSNLVYAKLEDNPTLFTLDADSFKNLESLKTSLRDRRFLKFDIPSVSGMDVDTKDASVKLRSLKDGKWELLGSGGNIPADSVKMSTLLATLSNLSARDFVSDNAKVDFKSYGLENPSLKITLSFDDKTERTLLVGSTYKYGAATLAYAALEGGSTVYGIPTGILKAFPSDQLDYRSRIINTLPEKATISAIRLVDLKSGKAVFELSAEQPESIAKQIAEIADKRKKAAAEVIFGYGRSFVAQEFEPFAFGKEGFKSADGKLVKWSWALEITASLPGTGKTISQTRTYFLSDRTGGTEQYGGFSECPNVFAIPQKLINALFEFETETIEKAKAAPKPKMPEENK